MNRKIIIIPAFNEEESIASVVEDAQKYSNADLVVIDDASQDLTASKAEEAGAFVIRHPFNMGYGVAIQTGYKYALRKGYDLLVQIDGDGQHNPKYIPDLFEKVESRECNLAIGSRFMDNGEYHAGLLKSVGIWFFRFIVWMITRQKITDPTSGYQCLDRTIIEIFTRDSFPSDYPDANIIVMLHRMGFTVRDIPVEMVPNHKRRGMHQGIFTLSYYFFKMFLTIFIALIKEEPIPSTS
jgi:glycosyltransferase involved in cell wall biosynthesis